MAEGFTYVPTSGRYYYPNGQPVPMDILRESLAAVIQDSQGRMTSLADRLAARELDTLGWRLAMRQELRVVHGVSAQLAFGGREAMGASERGWLGSVLRGEYTYLDRFALQLATGEIDQQAPGVVSRMALYAQAAWSTWQAGRARQASDEGADEVRNILDEGADHCDECAALTDGGWMPIDDMSDPGDRTCLSNCRCELEFRNSAEAAQEGEPVGAEA